MLANALGNTSNITNKDDTYLIQQGGNFVNEYPHVDTHGIQYAGSTDNPNHLLGTFSCLFPYSFGGFEIQWPRTISYEAHAKWSMKYANKHFHKDLHFMFQVFGVIQKWQVCRSAILQVHKKTFHENEASFTHLTPEDLVIASHEEAQKTPPSNPTICSLRKHITAIHAKVIGTDKSRINIRTYIWGMTILKNPPSLWITINPSDTQDPIAQVLAGKEINLDDFDSTDGPDSFHCGIIIANDPYVAANFFHFIIKVIIEELMGIKIEKQGSIHHQEGIFRTVEGYTYQHC